MAEADCQPAGFAQTSDEVAALVRRLYGKKK
jgi:hypothetical protein